MKRFLVLWLALVGVTVLVAAPGAAAPLAPRAAPAKINGSGSTYVALAMQQWVADAQTEGLLVNYAATGSPTGLGLFSDGLIDFAGTEAEYSALGSDQLGRERGYQYVPDVAGAVAIMYNVVDQAGRAVDYLRMSRSTVAKIFMGYITSWADPQITADNKGLVLPDEPIQVVYRGGQSGTTALFYDFVANTEPALFQEWANKHRFPTQVRIIQLDSAPNFAPSTFALGGSDQIAQYTASPDGRWSIAYDEFGYAVTYGAQAARIENQSGDYVLPFAENISAALESAKLRPDLSQDLRDVYRSPHPAAYPISAYSYLVTQCAPDAQRDTCKGPYTNPGVAETLSKWMRYIACEGQVTMAQIGYSPLPPHLSQEVVNSIARMNGTAVPETLSAANCKNPRFGGSLGSGSDSPDDPLDAVPDGGLAGDGAAVLAPSANTPGASSVGEVSTSVTPGVATGVANAARAIGGGSTAWRQADPLEFVSDTTGESSLWPVLVLLAVVGLPPLGLAVLHARRPRTI